MSSIWQNSRSYHSRLVRISIKFTLFCSLPFIHKYKVDSSKGMARIAAARCAHRPHCSCCSLLILPLTSFKAARASVRFKVSIVFAARKIINLFGQLFICFGRDNPFFNPHLSHLESLLLQNNGVKASSSFGH